MLATANPALSTLLTLLANLPPFGRTVRLALGMNPEIYTLAQQASNGLTVALLIMLLAASSEAVGQSVVLFLNRVRPWRFALAVALSVVANIIGYLLWSTAIWLAVRLVFGVEIAFVAALVVVGLAYAPQLLAFFEMAPYFGNLFAFALSLWTMTAIVIAIRWGMGLELWQAGATGVISWLAIQMWRRSVGRPIYALGRWLTRGAAGKPLPWKVDDVVEGRLHRRQYSSNWKQWRSEWLAANPAALGLADGGGLPAEPAREQAAARGAGAERAAHESDSMAVQATMREPSAHGVPVHAAPVHAAPVPAAPVPAAPATRSGGGDGHAAD